MRMEHRWTKIILLLILLAVPACSKSKQPPPRIVPVVAVPAEQKDVPLQVKAIGNVEAYTTVAVKSLVSGETPPQSLIPASRRRP